MLNTTLSETCQEIAILQRLYPEAHAHLATPLRVIVSVMDALRLFLESPHDARLEAKKAHLLTQIAGLNLVELQTAQEELRSDIGSHQKTTKSRPRTDRVQKLKASA